MNALTIYFITGFVDNGGFDHFSLAVVFLISITLKFLGVPGAATH